ncbi:M10 family metallopeptidase C-terminal domain-containing protein [Paracoccus sp. Ld10]|uniref:M10 family metallopeptidase C-terminal domain-containing protein n=1 Tax=Paracoccus sp. Ld10 TaxID=649158 RepID=UPI00386DEBC9
MAEFAGTTVDVLRATLRETTDAPAGRATPYRMAPGDVFNGTIGYSEDDDWVAVRLEAGTTYRIELNGISLADPLLELRGPDGGLVDMDDDGGPGYNSLITVTPLQTGTYYANAGAYSSGTGSYQLVVAEARPPQPAPMAELATYLTDGFWAETGQAPRSFDTSRDSIITYDFSGLTAQGRALARDAMQAWSAVADLRFVQRSGNADITFDDDQEGAFAQATMMDGQIIRSSVNVDTDWIMRNGTGIGTYSYQTYVHEIGHALGLGHQGPYNGSGSFADDARFMNDSWQASVMSYFAQDENPNIAASLAYAASLMPADIIAIQRLYGAAGAGSLTAGNTVYGVGHTLGNSWLGRVFLAHNGAGQPTVQDARAVAMTIYDAGGYDMLNFGNDGQAQRVDLRAGAASDIYGLRGNLQIAHNTVIEGYVAGSGNDAVHGNAFANVLRGMGGNDRLSGGWGNDILHGGLGNDTLFGDVGADRLSGNQGNDTLTDLYGDNAMAGGYGNDTLTAGAGRDSLYGNDGADLILAGAGDDLIQGNTGFDTIRAGAGNDRAEGGWGNDIVDGGWGNDRLFGQPGNDTMVGGLGADAMAGGLGADTFRFFSAADSTVARSDVIVDFNPDQDVIDLRALDVDFVGNRLFSSDGSVRWDHSGGMTRILIDVDGDRLPDMLIRLTGRLQLDADSFLL